MKNIQRFSWQIKIEEYTCLRMEDGFRGEKWAIKSDVNDDFKIFNLKYEEIYAIKRSSTFLIGIAWERIMGSFQKVLYLK